MDIIAAYREAGTYRGAAQIAGTTHKTVKRVIARQEAGGAAPQRAPRGRNHDGVAALVAERVKKTSGRISAKRLLPAARAAGYQGSDRNFRRLVAEQKASWRREHHRGRRPAVWSPGEHLVIDWGAEGGLHVFCAVLAWCRFRFVRFAADERAATTLALLAECFEVLGGVPGKVLADRMGCLKGGVVANVVVPTAQYVRFAAHNGFRPDFCEAADPESKGIVENLVGYAKADLMVPQAPFGDLAAANAAAAAWCAEVNGAVHSEICAVPAERLVIERELLAPLPSLRASIGRHVSRKVDRLSCVLPHPQRHRHHRRNPRRILHRSQPGQPRAVREPGRRPPGHRAGQPGLAHPARPGHRHQPVLLQQARHLAHRPGPADKARQHDRETMHAGGGHTRRRPLHPRTITAGSEPSTDSPGKGTTPESTASRT